jgi:hypothetical protein
LSRQGPTPILPLSEVLAGAGVTQRAGTERLEPPVHEVDARPSYSKEIRQNRHVCR